MFQDVANFRCLRSYFAQPLTLREFQVAQQNWQHDLFEKAKHVAQKLQSAPWQGASKPSLLVVGGT